MNLGKSHRRRNDSSFVWTAIFSASQSRSASPPSLNTNMQLSGKASDESINTINASVCHVSFQLISGLTSFLLCLSWTGEWMKHLNGAGREVKTAAPPPPNPPIQGHGFYSERNKRNTYVWCAPQMHVLTCHETKSLRRQKWVLTCTRLITLLTILSNIDNPITLSAVGGCLILLIEVY